MMSGMDASNFRRIHIGLMLDLILMFLMPAVLAVLMVLVINDLSSAIGSIEGLTAAELLVAPIPALKAAYIVLILQYCLSALCALLIVSGLGELNSDLRELQRSKRWFILFMAAEGAAMLTHIFSILIQEGNAAITASTLYFAALLLLLALRSFAMRSLLRCFVEVLECTGASEQARRASGLSRRIVAAALLLMLLIVAAFILALLDLVSPTRVFVLGFAAAALIFYIVCRFQIVHCARSVTKRIAALSE